MARQRQDHPPSSGSGPADPADFQLDANGKIIVLTRQPGNYTISTADGRTHSLTVPQPPASRPINEPWMVTFPGLSSPLPFNELVSWTTHSDAGVKYFSGTAVYRTSFEAPATKMGERVMLDLGRVESMAEVTLNGRNMGWLWMSPSRVDITEIVKAGANTLEVKVINTWHNRLVGQKHEPAAFSAPNAFKPWLAEDYDPGKDLKPAGLLGPVQVLTTPTAVVHN
jgi:hypothetical protein